MENNEIVKINEKQLKEIVKESIKKVLFYYPNNKELDIETLFKFNSISEEELKKQYVDLAFAVSSSGYGGKFMGINGEILKEEATSTLSIEETKQEIQNKFHLKDWQFATQIGSNGIRLVVLYPGIFKNTKLIKQAMSACGWSLAIKGYIVRNKMIWRAMSFDPMFQKDVSDEARQYQYLYHWTPLYNLESIIKNGLIPRSENKLFDYPNRLHLIKGNTNQNEIFNIGRQLCATNKKRQNNGDYVLLSINLSQVPNNTEIYYDPRYEWGYYTKVQVPYSAINPIFGYNFKTNTKFDI